MDFTVPLGSARIAREGADVTVVTWSKMAHVSLSAAAELSKRGVSTEVIDLRTLWPWDTATVLSSVAKTGRLIVVQEAVLTCGFGAEVAATVAEELDGQLKAPVRRLGAPRAPIAYSKPLEDRVRVTVDQVVEAALKLVRA